MTTCVAVTKHKGNEVRKVHVINVVYTLHVKLILLLHLLYSLSATKSNTHTHDSPWAMMIPGADSTLRGEEAVDRLYIGATN